MIDRTALRELIASRVGVIAATPSGWIVRTPEQIAVLVLSLPDVAAIIDLAAEYDHDGTWVAPLTTAAQSEAVRTLLADWRETR